METIRFQPFFITDVTIISNSFLDRFLPTANGDFLRIYLYLLRAASSSAKEVSLCAVADQLNCTENDVRRALRFWKREGALEFAEDGDGTVSYIGFSSLCGRSQVTSTGDVDSDTSPEDVPPVNEKPKASSPKAILSRLKDQEELRTLFESVALYLERPVSNLEMQKLCVLYDEFRFSTELIDYLISYVAGLDKFKTGSRRGVIEYATRVAVTWNENHITTPAEAADYLRRSQGNYYKILSFLGSRSHTPQDKEIAFMSKWLDTYGFSMEIIKEACGRAVLKKKDNATLNYVDKILTSWHLNGADTLEKIELLDDEHKKSSSADTKSVSPQGSSAKKNSFNDFPQRTYDWDEIQSRLTGVDKR